MKYFSLYLSFVVVYLAQGCASYTTYQEQDFYVGTNLTEVVRTKVRIRTVLDAHSELTKSAVITTSKTQSSKIGAITQTATNNIPEVAGEVAKGVVEGLKIP